MTSGSPPGGAGAGRPSESGAGYRERVLPTTHSILWNPTTSTSVPRRGPGGAFPVFLEQQAITAIQAHHQAAGKQGMMGFLVGDICRCPTSQVKYVIIDSTVRLNQAVYGDKTLVIISRLWDRLQEELRRSEGHLIGWYHSHPPIAVELAPGDVETHMQYFTRPWHTALVVGTTPEGQVAGLFRPGPGDTWPTVSLPFYELIDDADRLAGGFKTSILPWQNFTTDDPAVSRHGTGEAPVVPGLVPSRSTLEVVAPAAPTGGGRASVTQPRPAAASKPTAPPAPPAVPPSPPPARRASAAHASPPTVPQDQAATVETNPLAPPKSGAPAPPPGKPTPPGKRGASLKPPPGALSNLPLLSVGGYDVGPVDIRPSDPQVMTPQAVPALPIPPAPRRAKETTGSPPAVKLPVAEIMPAPPERPSTSRPAPSVPKPEKHWGAMVATIVVLALLGAAGWYFVLGPGRAQFAALRGAAAPSAPAPSAASTSPGAAAPPPATPPVSTPAPSPAVPTAADSALQRFDGLAESVAVAVRGYDDRAKLFAGRQLDCAGLSRGLASVEDIWTAYNVQGKKKAPPLDATRTTRDQTLYSAVDSVERHFDRSQCQRP